MATVVAGRASCSTADALPRPPRPRSGIELAVRRRGRDRPDAPLAQPVRRSAGGTVGNRFCILPMEGWDGTADGRPTELDRAPLAALRPERRQAHLGRRGRRRPPRRPGQPEPAADRATTPSTTSPSCATRWSTRTRERFGATDDLLVGLQLTHSGRFARPTTRAAGAAHRLPPSRPRPPSSASPTTRRCSPTTSSTASSTTSSPPRELAPRGRLRASSTSSTATATSATSS